MISPSLIKVIYLIGLVGIGLFGLFGLVTSIAANSMLMVLIYLILVPLAALLWRVAMEQAILFFKMYDELRTISSNQNRSNI